MDDAVADPERVPIRFIGLDVHKHYAVAAGVDERQYVVLSPRRVELSELPAWTAKTLQPTDVVVLEAMFNTWNLYDQLSPVVAAVVVANPARVARMKEPGVKTDAGDALFLARLLASGMLPTVWVPPLPTREVRTLVTHRQRLITQRTRSRNRLHAVLLRRGIQPPEGELFSAAKRGWWDGLELSHMEQLRVHHDLAMLETLKPLIAEAEAELFHLSREEPWASQVAFLVQLPGIQVLTAMVLLAAIGDINRFPSDRKLAGYAGLGASIHDSGQTHRTGHITKRGRRELRGTMVEAAWNAVRTHPFWKAEFSRLVEGKHLHAKAAVVAIARQLLVVVWHVLFKREADREAIPDKVARKFLVWSYRVGRTQRAGDSCGMFVRSELNRVGLQPPPSFRLGNHVIDLAALA
ncbi:MAG TPA: IS110 family transposase [Chloroflexota bacterium]